MMAAIFLLAVSPVASWAQSPIEADALALRYDSTHAEVELDYGVLQRALAFKGSGTIWTAVTSSKVEIWQKGTVAQSKDIHDTVHFTGTHAQLDSAGANKLLGAMGFAVPYSSPIAAVFIWQRGEKTGKGGYDTIVVPSRCPIRTPQSSRLVGLNWLPPLSVRMVPLAHLKKPDIT